jgi:hypothetical protein
LHLTGCYFRPPSKKPTFVGFLLFKRTPCQLLVPGKVSNVSLILVNLWIDAATIQYTLFGTGEITLGIEHSLWGAMCAATVVGICGVRSSKWVFGAYLGGISHILSNMLVHADMNPFAPVFNGNAAYMG